jgi:hypothetical protein
MIRPMTSRIPVAAMLALLVCVTPQVWAVTCFETSPTISSGGALHDQVEVVELTTNQVDALRTLFAFADRRWKGTAVEIRCLGTDAEPRPKTTDFKLRASGESDRSGMMLDIEMSHDDGVRREILGLQVEGGVLKLREGGMNHVDLITVAPNEVAVRVPYSRRQRLGGVVHMEGFWSFARVGNDLLITSKTYSIGGLSGEARWRLKPR